MSVASCDNRIVVERAEHDRARPLSLQLLEGVHERRRFARRTKGDHPGDRQSHQPHRQRANRRNRSAVRPVGVVDRRSRAATRAPRARAAAAGRAAARTVARAAHEGCVSSPGSSSGSAPSNSAASSAASSTIVSLGSAALLPTLIRGCERSPRPRRAAGSCPCRRRPRRRPPLRSRRKDVRVRPESARVPRRVHGTPALGLSTCAPPRRAYPRRSSRFQIAGSCDARRRPPGRHSPLP